MAQPPGNTPEEAANTFHQMWVDSPGHDANVINRGYRLVGVGFFTTTGAGGGHTSSLDSRGPVRG